MRNRIHMRNNEMLLAFYRDRGRDDHGRTHSEILSWSDAMLEAVHDYIQWLFPLPEPSGVNPTAPLLTPAIRAAYAQSPEMRGTLRTSWFRMLRFYGFALGPEGRVQPAPNFAARTKVWLTPGNHNHLRLTRILRCLALASLPEESTATLLALSTLYAEDAKQSLHRISPTTFAYWQAAHREPNA